MARARSFTVLAVVAALALAGAHRAQAQACGAGDYPVVSTSFETSDRPSFIDEAINVTWTLPSCALTGNELYAVVLVDSSNQPIPSDVLCQVVGEAACTISIDTLANVTSTVLAASSLNFFVLVYYDPVGSPNTYYNDPTYSGFDVCISVAPVPTTLLAPVENTIFYVANSTQNSWQTKVTFSWNASYGILDYGRVCLTPAEVTEGDSPIYQSILAVATDINDLLITSTAELNTTRVYVQVLGQSKNLTTQIPYPIQSSVPVAIGPGVATDVATMLQTTGTFYWTLFNANNFDLGGATIFNITALVVPDPCWPLCVEPFGSCTKQVPATGGQCNCTSGYTGATCSIAPTTIYPTHPATNLSNNVALEAGVGVAAAVIVVAIAIVILYLLRDRLRARKDLEMSLILIKAPEYHDLAWSPYSILVDTKIENNKKASWTKFEQILLSQDFSLIFAIIAATKMNQMDNVLAWFVCVFTRHHAAGQLIEQLMIREIEAFGLQQNVAVPTDGAGLIPFREDSAATKAFKIYARVTGLPYLFDTLGQIINDFCAVLDEEAKKEAAVASDASSIHATERKSTTFSASMEVDPTRMSSPDDETVNRLALQLICQKLFVKIYRSTTAFPIELRLICAKVLEKSKSVHSLASINVNLVIANLVFLRFINPAVLMPTNYGLVKDDPTSNTKRQLVLITKVLQNLAGGVEFGKKEQYMVKLNPFIKQNTDKMQGFLGELSSNQNMEGTSSTANYTAPISDDLFSGSLINLYRHITSNFDAIVSPLANEAQPARAEAIRSSLMQCVSEIGTI